MNNGNGQYGYTPPTPNYGGYYPPPEKQTNGMAVASLVLGIVSFTLSCCCIGVNIICAILAIIFAIISKSKNPNGKMNGMAIAGLIIGAVGLVTSVAAIIICVLGSFDFNLYFDDFMDEFNRNYGYMRYM